MKIILYLSTFIISVSGLSQPVLKDSAADCVIHWRLGETRTYSIIHEKSATDGSGKTVPFRFDYEAHISVIDSSNQTFTVKWEFELPDHAKMIHPLLADSLPVFNGMPMIFKISKMGAFISLVNWEEIRDTYVRQLEIPLPKDRDSASLAGLKAAKQMFNSKESVESTLIKEIQLFHMLYGYQFTTKEAGAETQLPNPLGGEPFPAYQTFQLTSLDKAKDAYTIVVKLKIDKGNLDKIIDPLVQKMHVNGEASIEEARKQLKSYNMQDYTEYQFITSTGWIRRLFYVRTVSSTKVNQSDSYTIELQHQ